MYLMYYSCQFLRTCISFCISYIEMYLCQSCTIWSLCWDDPRGLFSVAVRVFHVIRLVSFWETHLYDDDLFLALYHSHCVYDDLFTLFRCWSFWWVIFSLVWLVTAGTVGLAYGQWLVYGEFNTLRFISRLQLAYKFQGRYSWYQSSRFHSS